MTIEEFLESCGFDQKFSRIVCLIAGTIAAVLTHFILPTDIFDTLFTKIFLTGSAGFSAYYFVYLLNLKGFEDKIIEFCADNPKTCTFYFLDENGNKLPLSLRNIAAYFRSKLTLHYSLVSENETEKDVFFELQKKHVPYEISQKIQKISKYHTKFLQKGVQFNQEYFNEFHSILRKSDTSLYGVDIKILDQVLDKYIKYLQEMNVKTDKSIEQEKSVEIETLKMALQMKGY